MTRTDMKIDAAVNANDARMIAEIAKLSHEAERILFITGAGLSADSGLPTYRGIGGLYNETHTEDNIPIELALSGDMLQQRPDITWKYLLQIESACRGAGFNLGHRIMAKMEELKPEVWVLTQNIDGFHRKAGSANLIEIHGKVEQLYCTSCEVVEQVRDYSHLMGVPTCKHCGSLIRPDVVLFGEMLPMQAVECLQGELEKGFDLIFSVGTTSVFPYIAQPVLQARFLGAKTIEINPGDTEVSAYVDYRLRMGASEALAKIWQTMGYDLPI